MSRVPPHTHPEFASIGSGTPGSGDMTKAVYDPDADGKVVSAVTADVASEAHLARNLTAPTANADHEGWLIYRRNILGAGELLCCLYNGTGGYEWVIVASPGS